MGKSRDITVDVTRVVTDQFAAFPPPLSNVQNPASNLQKLVDWERDPPFMDCDIYHLVMTNIAMENPL